MYMYTMDKSIITIEILAGIENLVVWSQIAIAKILATKLPGYNNIMV